MLRRIAHWSDERVALLLGLVLFALFAWPLALVEIPPLQDLPNHLVAVEVIQHPDRYPDLVFNGFLKTNSPFFLFVSTVGAWVGNPLASRLFVLLVIAANAWIYPFFVLRLTGSRGRMVVVSFVAWAMVHHWFLAMGMMNWSLAIPLSLAALVLIDRQRRAPSFLRGVAVASMLLLVWYAHVFPVLILGLLTLVHVLRGADWSARFRRGLQLLLPFAPSMGVIVASFVAHFSTAATDMDAGLQDIEMFSGIELFGALWANWMAGFTLGSLVTVAVSTILLVWGIRARRESPPFFSYPAMLTMLAFYAALPFMVTSWAYLNSRFIPYLWFGVLLRVPETLSRRAFAGLAACALLLSAVNGIDYLRLERDRERFMAGLDSVKQGTTLLPLVFRGRVTSRLTRSLQHAWAFYAIEKQTSVPLLFAHSRSFAVSYREAPHPQLNHLVLERWSIHMQRPEDLCRRLLARGLYLEDCGGEFAKRWGEFWELVTPRFEQVMLFQPTPAVLEQLPRSYRVVHESPPPEEGEPPLLVILERIGVSS